jgi:hypothetical protein
MAAPTPASQPPAGAAGMIPAEWPGQAADTIVDVVGKVRDKTTKPALTVARAFVYSALILVGGTVALIMLLIGSIKALEHVPGHIWTVYAAFAVAFLFAGSILIRKANAPKSES